MIRSVACVLALAAPCAAQVSFYGLGRPPGADTSSMTSVSADGRVTLGVIFAPTPPDLWVMRWTAEGGSERLVEPSNLIAPAANGLNFDGSVIVGSGFTGSGLTGFRWTRDGGYVLTPEYGFNGISDDARFTIGTQYRVNRPFRWSESEGYEFLGETGTPSQTSADGSVVMGVGSNLTGGAWRWTASTGQVSLGELPLGANTSDARDLSPDGLTIVGSVSNVGGPDSNVRPYRWTADSGYELLTPLPGADYSYANGVAADGRTIVGGARFGNNDFAVIWTADGVPHRLDAYLESLGADLTDWTLNGAFEISDDGLTIAGSGLRPNGLTEGWVVQIPTPSTALPVALLLLLGRRRR